MERVANILTGLFIALAVAAAGFCTYREASSYFADGGEVVLANADEYSIYNSGLAEKMSEAQTTETATTSPVTETIPEVPAEVTENTSEKQNDGSGGYYEYEKPHVDFPLNINTASEYELTGLPGIGEKKAAAIVEYRTGCGGFSSVSEIMNVSGIGEKTYEKIKDLICV